MHVTREVRMDSRGRSGVLGKAAQSPQWISTCPREKENQGRMNVWLPKKRDGVVGADTQRNRAVS